MAPGSIRPASGQPSERWPLHRSRAQQLRRGVKPALVRDQALVELDRPHLLEVVDDRVRVGAQGQARAGVGDRRALGRCRRPGRARSWGTGSSMRPRRRADRSSGSETWVKWTAVKRSESGAAVVQQLDRRPPVRRLARLDLGDLLGDVGMEWGGAIVRPRRDDARRVGIDGAHAVDRRADARPRPRLAERLDSLCPGSRAVPSLNRACSDSSGSPIAAVQVAGVQERDPDPGLLGGGQERPAHLVRVLVWPRRRGRGARNGTRRPR